MPSPSMQQTHSPSAEGEKHKQLHKEIRDMVSAITHRVTDFHKPGSTHNLENEEEHGLSMITLVGNNNGATMKSELDQNSDNIVHGDDEPEALNTYVNSNFQAINNSMMLGGSYKANDPGVHMDISDFFPEHHQSHHKGEKHEKKGKKKEKEGLNKHKHAYSSSDSD
ncbi:hypothetical protein VNO77_14986 [Canavalia gladiata]|uniref:Uncharacterized protein n=1 Tax=Canavalia gladiata TaxID=3824 RepID=A0AAN9M3X2_CANGL